MKEYLAYEGREFTIAWYFDAKGKSSALEYFDNENCLIFFRLMGDQEDF